MSRIFSGASLLPGPAYAPRRRTSMTPMGDVVDNQLPDQAPIVNPSYLLPQGETAQPSLARSMMPLGPTSALSRRAALDTALAARKQAIYAAGAPARRPEAEKAMIPGTEPGSMSVTLNAGEKPSDWVGAPSDRTLTAPNGQTTVARQGSQRLKPAEDVAQEASARRAAYVDNQKTLSRTLLPDLEGMDQRDAAMNRSNAESGARVGLENAQSRLVGAQADQITQLTEPMIQRMQSGGDLSADERKQLMDLLHFYHTAYTANEKAKQTEEQNKAKNELAGKKENRIAETAKSDTELKRQQQADREERTRRSFDWNPKTPTESAPTTQPAPKIGQTATGPKGEKIRWTANGWEPM